MGGYCSQTFHSNLATVLIGSQLLDRGLLPVRKYNEMVHTELRG